MNDQPPLHPPPNVPPPLPGAVPPPNLQGPRRADEDTLTRFVARHQTAAMLGAFAVGVFFGVLMRR